MRKSRRRFSTRRCTLVSTRWVSRWKWTLAPGRNAAAGGRNWNWARSCRAESASSNGHVRPSSYRTPRSLRKSTLSWPPDASLRSTGKHSAVVRLLDLEVVLLLDHLHCLDVIGLVA